jgi:VWFA-related protein
MRILLALLFVAGSASAQLIETIEVQVTNVDVVVTDRFGKPVTGLTKDDFELWENDKLQTITNFYELRQKGTAPDASTAAADEVPAELQRRRLVIFVDQDSIDPRRRHDAIAAVSRALDHILRPADEAMIISYFHEARIVADLTSDRDVLHRALTQVAAHSAGIGFRQAARNRVTSYASDQIAYARENELAVRRGGSLRRVFLTPEDAYENAITQTRAYAQEMYTVQSRLIAALHGTLSSMAGLDGRKVLLFIGGDLQQRPGIELFDAIDTMFRAIGVSIVNSSAITHESSHTLTGELDKLAREANANGVTLYFMSAADTGFRRSAASSETPDSIDAIGDTMLDLQTAAAMTSLALSTGGSALASSVNYDLALERIARDLSSYYSLGYRPPPGKKERTLRVRTKNHSLVVRARRSYTLESVDEQMNDRVVSNAFHPRAAGEIPVTVEVGTAQRDGDVFRVPVTIRFPGDLTTIPAANGLAGEVAVYFVTASLRNGSVSPVARDIRPFQYTVNEAQTIQSKPITYTSSLRVRAGEQLVSVAVVDRLAGRSGYARAKFVAP